MPEKEMIWLFYTGTVEKKDLALHLRERLPGFMIPRKFRHVSEFPRIPSGKVDSKALREMMT
jgi:acyl-CoA synthetase (AMP-forming)/AMP-acid ligase II